MVLLLATTGCIEVKEKPPQGSFTIDVESEAMFFVPATGGELMGPEATVETDLHEEEPQYAWDIEGVGDYEGAEVDVPATSVGVRPATYDLEYFGEVRHVPVFVTTLPTLSGIYLVVGNGTQLEENDSVRAPLEVQPGDGLTELHADQAGTVLEFAGRLSEGIAVNVTLPQTASNSTTYVLGLMVHSSPLEDDVGCSVAIHPGQVHRLLYRDGVLNLTVHPVGDASNITFEGDCGALPGDYRGGVGQLSWSGEVGEHESPGFATWAAVLALTVVMVVARRSPDRRP